MSNYPRKVRPITGPIRKERKPKQEPKVNYYQLQKFAALRYDYGQIDAALREQVQMAALEIQRWQRSTVEVGRTLLAVKELLPHRQFLNWLMVEFGLKERSVQSMMNVARVYGEPEKAQRVALLSAGALYELAAPSTPAAARAVIEERIAAGEIPTRAEVKQVIDAYRPPKPPKPKQLPAPPVAELEPDEPDAITAEYTVVAATLSFAEWLAAMPSDLSLRDHLAILELAKGSATKLRNMRPTLYHAVSNVMMLWSQLITAVEKELRK
jgi:hypothetical protein